MMAASRAALVTGASSGIGFAIASMLVEEGFGVTAVARRETQLTQAAEQLRAAGGNVVDVAADVSDEPAMRAAVEEHQASFDRLDVLVNNAGMLIAAPLEEIETEQL